MKTKVRVFILLILLVTIISSLGIADEYEAWVVCQPNDYINVRLNPSRKSMKVGYADAGDSILIDGTVKNGFLRCYGIGEDGQGWIHSGYVVFDKPTRVNGIATVISKAKLAARKYIGGKVRKWLHNMDQVKVYWISSIWCVTSEGFVKTEYLEMEW